MNDKELLETYARNGSEAAFGTLVERHLNLVHSVAMRQVGQPHLAEEVSQAVFLLLARKAAGLKSEIVLSGWLFHTTRFVAARAQRTEQRRQKREQEAYAMQQLTTENETWHRIAPVLDEALEQLGKVDRHLMLLRFYEGKNHKEAGAALGLSEDAARKRGARALEKLRQQFAHRGMAFSGAIIASTLVVNAVKAAPASLGTSVMTATGGKTAVSVTLSGLVQQTVNAWRWSRIKLTASYLAVGAGVALLILLAATHTGFSKVPSSGDHQDNRIAASVPAIVIAANEQQPDSANTKTVKKQEKHKALHLRIETKDSGLPVAGARLAIVKWRLRDGAQGVESSFDLSTDDDGICVIPITEDLGRLDAGILSPGWSPRFATWKPLQDDTVPAEYTLRVDRVTNSVGGWLRDTAGKPVFGATINLQMGNIGSAAWREEPRERAGVMGSTPIATTDREGHWSSMVIPTDNPGFNLEAVHADFPTTAIASSHPGSDNEEKESIQQLWAGRLVTVLTPGLELLGQVTDEAGHPIAGAAVEHQPTSNSALRAKTDANGDFVLRKLKPKAYGLAFSAEGFAPEYRQITAKPGIGRTNIVLKPGALLRLLVVDQSDMPVPDAEVILEQWGEHRGALNWRGTTSSDGRIEWSSAPPGNELELCVRKDGWCYARNVKVVADGKEHTIKLMPALTLSGYVKDGSTGKPVTDFKVFPGYGEGSGDVVWYRMDVRQGTEGKFTLNFNESRQPWRLRVEAAGYLPFTSDPLAPNFSEVFEIDMKPSAVGDAIRGRVLLPDGKPAADARIALLTLDYSVYLLNATFRDSGVGILTNADAYGAFAFMANPRAHSVAAVSDAGFAKLRVKSTAEPVTLQLQPWGRIEGTVTPSARTRPLMNVALMDELSMRYRGSVQLDANVFNTKPDNEGRFVFEHVPSGWFSLYISRGMGIPMTCWTPVEIRSGETTQAVVGGGGQTVTGKLIFKNGRTPNFRLPGTASARLNKKSDRQPNDPHPPIGDKDATALWFIDYWQLPEAREKRGPRSYPLNVSDDGSFVSEAVPPGEYQLLVFTDSGSLHQDVTVPESNADEPVDIGTFEIETARDKTSGPLVQQR